MTQVVKTNKWLYTLPLKQHLSRDESKEAVLNVASIFAKETARLSKKVSKSKMLTEEYAYAMSDKLDEVSGEFDFVVKLLDGTIDESDWSDYSFDGDYLKEFNNALSWLYDIGDERVMGKANRSYKFLFLTHS